MPRALVLSLLVLCGCKDGGQPPPASPSDNPPPAVLAAPMRSGPVTEADADPAQVGRAPTSVERGAIESLLREVSEIRGLAFTGEVRIRVLTAHEITRWMEVDYDADDLAEAHRRYGALGLLDAETDLTALLGTVLGEQVVGFYDPEREALAVRDDVMRGWMQPGADIDEARVVIVHELTHVLQGQQLGLGEILDDDEMDSDAAMAIRAVVEGDATLAMFGWMLRARGMPLARVTGSEAGRALLRLPPNAGASGSALSSAPAILRATLVSPYADGLQLAVRTHAAGGFAAIDQLFRTPPPSMEQVLHPDKARIDERPDVLRWPEMPAVAAAGEAIDDDTLGELELGVFLAQGSAEDRNLDAAEGWNGDRLRVVQRAGGGIGDALVLWATTWDADAEAVEAEQAVQGLRSAIGAFETHRVGRALLIHRGLEGDARSEALAAFDAMVAGLPPGPSRRAAP